MQLLVSSGSDAGRVIAVDRELVIGRVGGQADITLDDGQVSSRHAAVRPTAEGIEVEDLGSTNGTFIGAERLSAPHTLKNGDRVRLGGTELQAQISASEAPTAGGGGTIVQAGGGTTSRASSPPPSPPLPLPHQPGIRT